MMEGISAEAASLTGHLGLDNICWVYDNNHITIEGDTRITSTEDIAARSLGYGWNVLRVGDANDIDLIENALKVFRETAGRPTFIILDSHIGYGAPHKQDTAAAHREPLGEQEVRLCKRFYGWPEDAKFFIPDGVQEHFAAGLGAPVGRRRGADGLNSSWPIRPTTPIPPPRSTGCSTANCPLAGTVTFSCSLPTPKASQGVMPRARY